MNTRSAVTECFPAEGRTDRRSDFSRQPAKLRTSLNEKETTPIAQDKNVAYNHDQVLLIHYKQVVMLIMGNNFKQKQGEILGHLVLTRLSLSTCVTFPSSVNVLLFLTAKITASVPRISGT